MLLLQVLRLIDLHLQLLLPLRWRNQLNCHFIEQWCRLLTQETTQREENPPMGSVMSMAGWSANNLSIGRSAYKRLTMSLHTPRALSLVISKYSIGTAVHSWVHSSRNCFLDIGASVGQELTETIKAALATVFSGGWVPLRKWFKFFSIFTHASNVFSS